jgi:3-oxoacyl-(acyl-carrier-protein) synthase
LGVDHTLGYCAAGMLAASGRCRFADGFIRADGCGVLVLKILAQAAASRDRIHAVILAWLGCPSIASQDAEPITKVPTRPVRTRAHSATTRVGGQVSGMGW